MSPNLSQYDWRWHDEDKTIIICTLTDRWTWDIAIEVVEKQIALMKSVDHNVFSIFEFLNTSSIVPVGGHAFSRLRHLISLQPPNEDLVFFVGKNTMIEVFINIVASINKITHQTSHYHFVPTLEIALDRIQEHKRLFSQVTL